MLESQEHQHDETIVWQGAEDNRVVRITDQSNPQPEQDEVDTTTVLAPDDRDSEPDIVPADGGDKKPPVPPETVLASSNFPEDDGEGQEQIPTGLGKITAGAEVESAPLSTTEERFADLPPTWELVRGETFDLVVNRGHENQALVDQAVTRLTDGSAWFESEQQQYPERTFHADDLNTPTLFAKTTQFALDESRELDDGINELVMSREVKKVVDSEQAQLAVREQGFSGIHYVEPLAMAVSVESDAGMTIYPWQHGQLTPLADVWELEIPEEVARDELDRVSAVVEDLRALLGANGIEAPDLSANQILIDENNNLALLDIEEYQSFDTPEPALAPAASAHFKQGKWYSGSDPAHAWDVPEMATVEQGVAGVARGAETAEDSPEFAAEWHGQGTVGVFWNAVSKESAIINAANSAEWEASVSQVIAKVPNVSRQGTILHAFGADTEVIYGSLFDGMAVRNKVLLEGSTDIYFNTGTGRIEVYSEDGDRTFMYQPPSTREAG